jgi:hypothetical protein
MIMNGGFERTCSEVIVSYLGTVSSSVPMLEPGIYPVMIGCVSLYRHSLITTIITLDTDLH